MRNLFNLILCLLSTVYTMAQDNNYNNYCSHLYDILNARVAISENFVKYQNESPILVFTFGEQSEELPTVPIFEAGPIIHLSKECKIVIMGVDGKQKPRPESYLENREYNVPIATSWMLNNCDTPWAQWYINNTGGVVEKDSQKLSEEDYALLRQKVAKLRSENELCIVNTRLTDKVNCDRIFIVRIPNIEKVGTHRPYPELSAQKTLKEIKDNTTECYAVEFYKHSSIIPLQMLFFIDGNATNIEECVNSVAEYIKFE